MLFPFRALFWLAVVAFLMPREPDVGFGQHPGPAQIVRGAVLAELAAVASKLNPAPTAARWTPKG